MHWRIPIQKFCSSNKNVLFIAFVWHIVICHPLQLIVINATKYSPISSSVQRTVQYRTGNIPKGPPQNWSIFCRICISFFFFFCSKWIAIRSGSVKLKLVSNNVRLYVVQSVYTYILRRNVPFHKQSPVI